MLAGAAWPPSAVTVILRMVLPKRRPSLAARASFVFASALPRQVCAGRPQTRSSHGPRR